MKITVYALIAIGLALGISQASAGINELTKRIQHEVAGNGWEITDDFSSITLIHTNVQFLNHINLPVGLDEEENWKEFSFTNNYRITILFDSKLSQAEYDRVSQLRAELIADRMKGVNPQSKDNFSTWQKAKGLLRLPDYYFENHSVYVYCSFDGLEIRPAAITKARDKIMEILDKTCSKYVSGKSEPSTTPNVAPPHR